MAEPADLPLTIPVHAIVSVALRQIQMVEGLDRDEAYLLARLDAAPEGKESKALLRAIEEAPDA